MAKVPSTRSQKASANKAVALPPALSQEIATTRDGRDITQPYVRDLLQARDPLLYSAVDWGAYDEILRDDQVFACLQQRIGAVVSRDWEVIPGDDDDSRAVEAADAMNATIKRVGWDRITRKMLYAEFYGYSVCELGWMTGERFDFDWMKVRHARRFRYHVDGSLRLLTRTNTRGEVLPDRKFWVHSAGGSDDDEPYGTGLAHWLYWPVLFKRNGLRFWNIFLDKFGTPTAVGKYPRGSTDGDIRKLLAALQSMAQDTGFVIPDGMAVELLSAARSGVGDYRELCAYMDGAIAKVVLSQTMTTDNGSSRAQGEVHADVKLEVIKSSADLLTDSFTAGPARWWTDFNYGPDVAAPIVRRVVEEEADLKQQAETDEILERAGWVRTEDSFRETYGEGYVRRDDPQAPSGSLPAEPVAVPVDGSIEPGQDKQKGQFANNRKLAEPAAASFAAGEPRPLYVYRKLINTQDLIDWAREQGFASTLPAEDLHVTVVYSKRPVNWFDMASDGLAAGTLVVEGGPRMVERLGEGEATALLFQASELRWRHQDMVGRGASWDWPSYIPHVTISYAAGDLELAKVKPFQGPLVFGPEIFEPIEEDWEGSAQEEATASFAEGTGDQMDAVTERMMAETADRVEKAMITPLLDRIRAATSEAEVKALLADALDIMDEAPLNEVLERAGFAVRLAAATSTGEGEALA